MEKKIIENIFSKFHNAFSKWQMFIGLSFLPENMRQKAAYAGIVQYPSLTELGPKRAAVTVNNICKFAYGTIPPGAVLCKKLVYL